MCCVPIHVDRKNFPFNIDIWIFVSVSRFIVAVECIITPLFEYRERFETKDLTKKYNIMYNDWGVVLTWLHMRNRRRRIQYSRRQCALVRLVLFVCVFYIRHSSVSVYAYRAVHNNPTREKELTLCTIFRVLKWCTTRSKLFAFSAINGHVRIPFFTKKRILSKNGSHYRSDETMKCSCLCSCSCLCAVHRHSIRMLPPCVFFSFTHSFSI